MTTLLNIISVLTIVLTMCFVIGVGAPFYIIVLVSLGLGGPLLCSLGAIGRGD